MNATSTMTRDGCVLEILEKFGGMIRNFSKKHNLDFDECYQHVSLVMLEAWPKIAEGKKPQLYLYGAMVRSLYQLLKQHLDYRMPLTSLYEVCTEWGTTLADILEAPYMLTEAEVQRTEKVTEVVHRALSECRIEEQEYAVKSFGLADYVPVMPVNHPLLNYSRKSKTDKPRRTDHLRASIKRVFGKHAQVLALLQRETLIITHKPEGPVVDDQKD